MKMIGVCILSGKSVTKCFGGTLESYLGKKEPHYAISSFWSYVKEMYSL